MFLNDKLLGYLDMNYESLNTNSQVTDAQLFVLNKINFDSNNHNCLIQSNENGQIEIIASRDIQTNEEIICWFSETYLKNIKSNF